MNKYYGECIGGPWDGQRLVHTSNTKKLFRPMIGYVLSLDPPIIPVMIGEYRLNDYQQWHWWPTEEGKAMDKLLGSAK